MKLTGWKAFERYVAAIFGTTRLGPVGKDGPDCVNAMFSVECKQHATIRYTQIEEWMAEVRVEATDGRVPVLVMQRRRGPGKKAAPLLFVLDEQGWKDLHGVPSTM